MDNVDKQEPMKTCRFYCVEDENLDFIHSRKSDDGFCILKDLFFPCEGCSCELYQFDENQEDD